MSAGASEGLTATVADVLRHAPEWVRHDLGSRERSVRVRAEDTLAAMITVALAAGGERAPNAPDTNGRLAAGYPDRDDREKQLFEYLLVVRIDRDWRLQAIHEFDWGTFREVRSWDSRMNAWYVGLAAKTLARSTLYTP